MARDMEKEARWAASDEQKHRRAQRNKARRAAIREGLVKKGDNREVHHLDAPRKGSLPNKVKVVSKKENRSIQPKRK